MPNGLSNLSDVIWPTATLDDDDDGDDDACG